MRILGNFSKGVGSGEGLLVRRGLKFGGGPGVIGPAGNLSRLCGRDIIRVSFYFNCYVPVIEQAFDCERGVVMWAIFINIYALREIKGYVDRCKKGNGRGNDAEEIQNAAGILFSNLNAYNYYSIFSPTGNIFDVLIPFNIEKSMDIYEF